MTSAGAAGSTSAAVSCASRACSSAETTPTRRHAQSRKAPTMATNSTPIIQKKWGSSSAHSSRPAVSLQGGVAVGSATGSGVSVAGSGAGGGSSGGSRR